MAFSTDIGVRRELPVINGFVALPDGQRLLPTKLTPLNVLELIPGSTLFRLSPYSGVQEIVVSDPTSLNLSGRARRLNRLFIRLPEHDRLEGPPEDWFSLLRAAAELA